MASMVSAKSKVRSTTGRSTPSSYRAASFGLFLGFGGITKGGVSCGSAFMPDAQAALVADLTNAMDADAAGVSLGYNDLSNASNACTDATSNRKPIAWGLTAPGGVLLALGCIIYLADLQARREGAREAASAADDVA